MAIICDKCKHQGLSLKAQYLKNPIQFWEGPKDAKILIVGFNPDNDFDRTENRTSNEMIYLNPMSHPYFRQFRSLSQELFYNWESDDTFVAHTDMVKCSCENLLLKFNSDDVINVINNCSNYLVQQIQKSNVKIIICNGEKVYKQIEHLFLKTIIDDKKFKKIKIGNKYIKLVNFQSVSNNIHLKNLINNELKIILT